MIPHSRPTLNEKDVEAVSEVIRSGKLAQGLKVEEFENSLSSYIGIKKAVALSSGTAALHLSLLCLGIREGDEVIIPSYTCSALLNAVVIAGATPRFADIMRDTYNIDPDKVESHLKKKGSKVKAIIVVHSFGEPADIEAFLDISRRYDIPIIEDCAQALGATYKGKKVGSYGLMSVLSFYATKVIATGEGGMLLSNSSDIINRARDIREYDKKEDFKVRFNYKMTDMAAALGLSQLKRLPAFLKRREEIALKYDRSFDGFYKIPSKSMKGGRIYYRYVIELIPSQLSTIKKNNPPTPPLIPPLVRGDAEGAKGDVGGLESEKVDRFISLMEKDGISCRRPVFKPLHHFTGEKGYPNTELAWERSLSIPIYPSLTDKEVQRISDSIKRYKEII